MVEKKSQLENTENNINTLDNSKDINYKYFYKGKGYNSKKAIAQKHKVSVYTLYEYTKRGMSIEKSVELALQKKRKKNYTIGSQSFSTLKELCESQGLTVSMVRYHSSKYNMGYVEAIKNLKKKEKERKRKKEELKKKYFPEL